LLLLAALQKLQNCLKVHLCQLCFSLRMMHTVQTKYRFTGLLHTYKHICACTQVPMHHCAQADATSTQRTLRAHLSAHTRTHTHKHIHIHTLAPACLPPLPRSLMSHQARTPWVCCQMARAYFERMDYSQAAHAFESARQVGGLVP